MRTTPTQRLHVAEAIIRRFSSRWEAEFAQGFLEDAGVPSRITDDDFGGGHAYMGGLSTAALAVNPAQLEEARGILVAAGVLEAPDAEPVGPLALRNRALPPTLRADFDDLTDQLRLSKKAEMRHGIRCAFGFTPAALIPLIGLMREGNLQLVLLLAVMVTVWEGWKWIQAGKETRRLQAALLALDEETQDL